MFLLEGVAFMTPCSECGAPFIPRRQLDQTCSPLCSEARNRRRGRERKRVIATEDRIKRAARRLAERSCSECKVIFMPFRANHATCSRECSRKRTRRLEGKKTWASRQAAKLAQQAPVAKRHCLRCGVRSPEWYCDPCRVVAHWLARGAVCD